MRWSVFALVLVAACKKEAEPPPQVSPPTPPVVVALSPRISTTSGVRLRAAADANAAEVTKVDVGVILSALEKSPATQNIGGKEDFWYRVRTPDGSEGWVFGAFTAEWDPAREMEIVRAFANERILADPPAFPELADLVKMLTKRGAASKDQAVMTEMSLLRYRAIARAAEAAMAKPDDATYREWIKSQGDQLVYDEIGGSWLVNTRQLWDMEAANHTLPVAEEIAWYAAEAPLTGECEGILSCHISVLRLTYGQYLDRHPNGAHTDAAVKAIAEGLDPEFAKGQDKADKPEAKREIAALRSSLVKAGEKTKPAVEALTKLEKLL